MSKTILRIDSSPRGADSASRKVGDKVIEKLLSKHPSATVKVTDVSNGLPTVDGAMLGAWFTPEEARTLEQVEIEAVSRSAIQDVKDADVLVITVPMYNFSVPAQLKEWVDLLVRAGLTFDYTSEGYTGLIADKPAYIVMATGGVPAGSEMDHCSSYLQMILGFMGITSTTVIAADGLVRDEAQGMANAQTGIEAI